MISLVIVAGMIAELPAEHASAQAVATDETVLFSDEDAELATENPSSNQSFSGVGALLETYKGGATFNNSEWRIVPNGWLDGEVICASDGITGRVTVVYVDQESTLGPLPQCSVTGQASELFFDFFGPEVWGLKAGGNIEFNLVGDHPLWNEATPFLLAAYAELKNDHWRYLCGQYEGLVNPLDPTMINFGAGLFTGNLYGFRGQFRLERYFHLRDKVQVTAQTAISQEFVSDFIPPGEDVDEYGSDNGLPNLEGRVAIALGRKLEGRNSRVFEFGVSGFGGQARLLHLGKKYTPVEGMVGCDVQLGNERVGFRGEFYHGAGLSPIGGGIGQGINVTTGTAIHDTGGWAEIWTKPMPRVTLAVGYGIDHPLVEDLFEAPNVMRSRNEVHYVTVFWDVTKRVRFGLEVDYRKTYYLSPELTGLPGMRLAGANDAVVCWMQTRLTF